MDSENEASHPLEEPKLKNLEPQLHITNNLPEKLENRQPTDRCFGKAFFVCLGLLMPILIYTLSYMNPDLLSSGFDDCGNMCGEINIKYEQWSCTGKNYTNQIYLKDDGTSKTCVENCGDEHDFITCQNSDREMLIQESVEKYLISWTAIFKLTSCMLIVLGITYGMLLLLRDYTGTVVCLTIFLIASPCIFVVTFMWLSYYGLYYDTFPLEYCIVGTIFIVIFMRLIFITAKRMGLIIKLIKEASRTIFALQGILFCTKCFFMIFAYIILLWLVTSIFIATCGELTQIPGTNRLAYKPTPITVLTAFYHTFITVWSLSFVSGLQYMLIGATVSEWYFAEDKSVFKLIVKSYDTTKMHVGTVFFGSLILPLATVLRIIIKCLCCIPLIEKCMYCCLGGKFFEVLDSVTGNAYVVTAIHGKPFLKSGKRATELLTTYVSEVVPLKINIKFIMFLIITLTSLSSVLISSLIFTSETERNYVPNGITITFFLALICGCMFFSTIQTTVDTLFICYCEDRIQNDGTKNPYAMSDELLEFITCAKKFMGNKTDYQQFGQKTI